MTTLIFTLRGLDGEVIPNTEFKIIAGYPDDAFDPDLEIPSSQTFTTDGLGQATVELAAINLPYYVSKATNSIDDYIAFKLYVPESDVPLSAEFLYVDLGTHLHTLADKSMYTFIEAKVAVFNAVEQTVALAAGAAASASAASVSAAAALVSENAAEAAKIAAEAAADAAEESAAVVATHIAGLRATVGAFDGQLAFVSGYYSVGDGGGGFFRWNSASTSTDDGGITIKATASTTGRWVRIYSAPIDARWFGCKGDGSTDDYAGLSAASAAAAGGALYIPEGNYYVTNTIPLYSKTTYYGDGQNSTVITQTSANAPVMASTGYLGGASPTGDCIVRGLRVVGNTAIGSSNHGIVLRDYYSRIEHVRAAVTGGDAIHITTRTSAGTAIGGTLVENRIIDVDISDPVGYGIYVGELDNNKLTDGFIVNATINLSATSPDGIFIGSSAGWALSNIHVYGSPTAYALRVANAYHTNLSNIYVEGFTEAALYAPRIQRALAISNFTAKNEQAGKPAIRLDKSSLVTTTKVSISGLCVVNDSAADVYAIKTDTSSIYVSLGDHVLEQKNTGLITLLDMTTPSRCLRVTDAAIDGELRESTNKRSLIYEGMALAQSSTSQFTASSPAVSITKAFSIYGVGSYTSVMGTVHVNSRANYNGTRRCTYVGQVYIQAKLNGTDAWVVALDTIVAPSGFTSAPAATISDNGDGTGTLTIEFTPNDTDGYGAVKLILCPSES